MRHNKKINHLGRTHSHRVAMLSNMAVSLIIHKRIYTTTAKAKALRKYVEPLITKSKAANNQTITPITKTVEVKHKDGTVVQVERTFNINSSTPARRLVFSYLKDNAAVKELFGTVAAKVGDRPGGYTRIIKTGLRLGDGASMCFIELVDFNENMLKDSKKATKTRRSRRSGGKKATPVAEAAEATKVVESAAKTTETAKEDIKKEIQEAVEEATVETVEAAEAVETVETEAVEAAEAAESVAAKDEAGE